MLIHGKCTLLAVLFTVLGTTLLSGQTVPWQGTPAENLHRNQYVSQPGANTTQPGTANPAPTQPGYQQPGTGYPSNGQGNAYGQPQASPPQPATQPVNPATVQPSGTVPANPAPQANWAPFVLTPQQQAQVDQVLLAWERYSETIKLFESKFVRWHRDELFKKESKSLGLVKYAAPDKGFITVDAVPPNGDDPGTPAEKWICADGVVWVYDFTDKQLTGYQLPPGMKGKAIAEGPLPFLFGAKAESLKGRYFMRLIQPPAGTQNQIWLEAWPKTQQETASFRKAEIILEVKDRQLLSLLAIQLTSTSGNEKTAYQFYDTKVNPSSFLGGIMGSDPFKPTQPGDWKEYKFIPYRDPEHVATPPAGQGATMPPR